jgi:hypothetical protein
MQDSEDTGTQPVEKESPSQVVSPVGEGNIANHQCLMGKCQESHSALDCAISPKNKLLQLTK